MAKQKYQLATLKFNVDVNIAYLNEDEINTQIQKAKDEIERTLFRNFILTNEDYSINANLNPTTK